MIPEIGHIILISHLVLSFMGGILPLAAIYSKNDFLSIPTKKLSVFLFFLILLPFLVLVYSFLIDDFSVAYVSQNSNINLPNYYKLAATWGAHEGSLLLWILAMNGWLIAFMFFNNSKDKDYILSLIHI